MRARHQNIEENHEKNQQGARQKITGSKVCRHPSQIGCPKPFLRDSLIRDRIGKETVTKERKLTRAEGPVDSEAQRWDEVYTLGRLTEQRLEEMRPKR